MKKIITSLFVSLVLWANAQQTYVAQPKDTPYGISKKYGLTVEQFYQLNPEVQQNGLKIGDVVLVSRSGTNTAQTVTSNTATGEIIIEKGNTLYGLLRHYNVSMTDFKTLNPGVDENLQIGQVIKLPLANIQKFGKQEIATNIPTNINTESNIPEGQTYLVQPKDTYYKITHLYNISQADLFAMNPGLESRGLHPGDVVIVSKDANPVESESIADNTNLQEEDADIDFQENTVVDDVEENAPVEIAESSDEEHYKVKEGDTVFSILNRFGMTLDQLLALNPQLSEGLKVGMILTIKKSETKPSPKFQKSPGDALNVVLVLPFSFDEGNTRYREVALDFLTGAQLAIEKNAEKGKKLNIKIVDEGSEASFEKTLSSISQTNTDLVVGPFFKSDVVKLMSFLSERQVPVISPFANTSDLYQYNNLVIVETAPQYYAEGIAQEVAKAYKGEKIYILGTTYAKMIEDNLRKSLRQAEIQIVKSEQEIVLDQNMMTGTAVPIIAILASDDAKDKEQFYQQMLKLDSEIEGNKAFSMFYDAIFDNQQDKLKNTGFTYLMDRKINTEGSFEKKVLSDYQEKYCKAPTKYAVIGFDVLNDALSREDSNGEIFKHINKKQTQLATTFEYVKTKEGAYVNKGYRIVRILP